MSDGLGRELLRRRVPHIVGAYVAGCWALIEISSWLVDRFVLSPHIVDFVGLLVLLLIPSVILFAYFHGAPGRDRWTVAEKIGVPANILLAGVVLVSLFAGKDLGAATTTVIVSDEDGNTIERVVPKSAFRRQIAIFPFDNETDNPELDWLQLGVPFGVSLDLRQDLFVNTLDDPYARLREEGFPDATGVPLPLKRQIAEERHQSHLLTGKITGVADSVVITASLHEAMSGRLVGERTYSRDDLYALIDSITVQLKRDLEIPSQHLDDTQDLPARDILTESEAAYRAFVDGYWALAVDRDWQTAGQHIEAAVAEDPTFAYGQLVLYQVSLMGNRGGRAIEALQAAMDHSYRLPERDQYAVRTEYYQSVRQDTERALAVAEMRAELFPDDIEAHQIRAIYYQLKNEREKAIAVVDQILELDPSQHQFLQAAGSLSQASGDFERALGYHARYAELYPDDPDSFLALSNLSRALGKHDQARAQVERALLIDPESGAAIQRLAMLDADTGDFRTAARGYAQALDLARTPEQRASALAALSGFYEGRGQLALAIEHQDLRLAELAQVNPEFVVLLQRVMALDTWAAAGRGQEALDSLAAITARLSPPYDGQAAVGAAAIHMELENPDELEQAIVSVESYMETMGLDVFLPITVHSRGRLLELREDCEGALETYRESLSLEPTAYSRHVDIGRCQRKLGRLDEAEASLGEALRIRPSSPTAHYQLALVHEARGSRPQAVDHLRSALAAWADADPVFKPAAEARAKLEELEGS